jgi:O-antigen ligase
MFSLSIVSFLAPIYWLPFVPLTTYETLRDALFLFFFVALAFAVMTRQLRIELLPQKSGLEFVVVFLLSMVPSLMISPDFLQGSIWWLKALQAGLFYLGLLLVVDTKKRVRQLLILFMLGQLLSVGVLWLETISSVVGINLPWDVPFTMWTSSRGEIGLSFRRTAFSGSTAHILPIVLGLGSVRKGISRLIWVCIFVAALGAIIVSGGRGGLIAGLAVIFLTLWKKSRIYALILGFVTLLISFIAYPVITNLFVSSPEWTFWVDGWQQYNRLSGGRLALYTAAIELIGQYPFFGVGLGSFSDSLQSLETLGKLEFVPKTGPHNLYLGVGSESGIFSALVLVAFMIWALRKGWMASQVLPGRTFATPLFGILVAQFLTSLVEVEIFWTIMRAFPFWIALAGIVKFSGGYIVTDEWLGETNG